MKWISVKEKLPIEENTVFICVVNKYDDETEYEISIDLAYYDHTEEKWITENDWDEGQEFLEILFWKPIKYPKKPYKLAILEQIKMKEIESDFK